MGTGNQSHPRCLKRSHDRKKDAEEQKKEVKLIERKGKRNICEENVFKKNLKPDRFGPLKKFNFFFSIL